MNAPPMLPAPYSADDLANARHLVTHREKLAGLAAEDADEILDTAWAVLRDSRKAAEVEPRPAITATARVYRIPLAVFQAGLRNRRKRPRLIVLPQNPNHPGDAA